jgi:uncharacterized membrane protein (DUF4010 family)
MRHGSTPATAVLRTFASGLLAGIGDKRFDQ